jgi:hypothetical protein
LPEGKQQKGVVSMSSHPSTTPIRLRSSTSSSINQKTAKTRLGETLDRDPAFTEGVQTTHTSPGLAFFLGGLGCLLALVTNLTQMWTSASAFGEWFTGGAIYQHLKLADQLRVLPIINAASWVIAFGVQVGVLFVAFRVDVTWRKARAEGKVGKAAPGDTEPVVRRTAVEMVSYENLLFAYGGVCFVANCIGDYGFITTYTDNWLAVFFWGLVLTVGSTLLLMEAAQYLWSGYRAWCEHKLLYRTSPQAQP